MVTLNRVRRANRQWFAPGNAGFFNDKEYRILHDKEGKPYLVRSTTAWTDMFGQKPRLHCRINSLNADLSIGPLLDGEHTNWDAAQDWLNDE